MIQKLIIIGILGMLLSSCELNISEKVTETLNSSDCNKATLLSSQDFFQKDYTTKSFSLSESMPSEGAGGNAYFTEEGKLHRIEVGYYGSLGKKEIHYWLTGSGNYIVDLLDYRYEKTFNKSTKQSITQKRFFVCQNVVLDCNKSACGEISFIQKELGKILDIL